MAATAITGRITDSSLGQVGTFTASRDAPPDSGISIAGEYNGVFLYESRNAYQMGQINLVPNLTGGGLKLSAAVSLFYGQPNSGELLTYRFDETTFNSVTGLLTLSAETSDTVIKATVSNGEISGEWFSTSLGRMGTIKLSKKTTATAPPTHQRFPTIKGTYQGTLRNTSPDSNLPERILFGLISTLDQAAPRGLRLTGNLRLYYGPFDSHEYVELPFESVQLDPYRRTFTGKTSGSLRLTVQGILAANGGISGNLSDDSLGDVAAFEVAKNEQ
jgi:hypothetical protein